ncbi:hypothetical protein ACWIE7_11670 [Dietzia sp. NPDC055343]
MTDRSTARPDTAGSDRPRPDKARLDAVFDETLPVTTSDERRGRDGHLDDDWWREQRPPHHG